MINRIVRLIGCIGVCILGWSATVLGESMAPLHERIDRLVESAALGPLSPPADDTEFLRRISLDLTGIIPTPTEIREFIADKSTDKRAATIDRMIASPRFARQMALFFDVMCSERRNDKKLLVRAAEWQEYLRSSFAAAKPYNQLVREILAADGQAGPLKPAAAFYLARDCEPNSLTRDIGRFFFGMDLQCAQCHDHPLVDDYYQADYYGLYAFVARMQQFEDRKAKQSLVAEKADGEANFKSVFTGFSMDKVTPRLLKGKSYADPPTKKGEEYLVKPEKTTPGVPRFSRRLELASAVADGENSAFNRNIANRLWALMLGRGLVHPVDFQHIDNPASNPELLDLLSTEIRGLKYDVAGFVRQIALSRTYQRSSRPPSAKGWQATSLAARLLELEQADARCRKVLLATEQASQSAQPVETPAKSTTTEKKTDNKKPKIVTVSTTKRRVPPAGDAAALAAAKAAARLSADRLAEARSLLEFAKVAKTDPTAAARQWDSLVEKWTNHGTTAMLKPLTAEQLALSWMRASGMLATIEATAQTKLEQKPPDELKKASPADRARVLAELVEQRTFDQVRSNVKVVADLYGSAQGSDFQATLNQALFLGNGNLVEGLLNPTGDNLVARLVKLTTSSELADELYLATLSRLPSADERTEIAAYLKGRDKDRVAAISEMAWALLASNEFRFNH